MSNLAEIFNVKINQIKEEGKKLVARLDSVNSSLQSLTTEKQSIFDTINQYNGAIQAYTDSHTIIHGSSPVEMVEAIIQDVLPSSDSSNGESNGST